MLLIRKLAVFLLDRNMHHCEKSKTMSKKRRNHRSRRQSKQNANSHVRIIILLFAIVAIGFVIYASLPETGSEQTVNRLELDPVLGNPNAPVTVVEYGAYGCEACRAWHEAGIVELILEEFPDQVKFVYRDMPIILPDWSQEMAEVAQCALDHSNHDFWIMHEVLFTQTIQGRTSQQEVIALGANAGLNANELQSCVEANTHYNTVRYDMSRSEARGIRGTPTWFVNGQILFNASPATLRQAILNALES